MIIQYISLADNMIAEAYNSPDNYQKYKDIISHSDFNALIPYTLGDGENIKSTEDNIDDFYLYEICEFEYTDEKAIVSYSFDYYQFDKDDCRKTKCYTAASIYNPIKIYFVFDGEKWTVDNLYNPP